MNIDELVTVIKEHFPDKAIDVSECLDLLLYSLDSIIKDIHGAYGVALTKRDFSNIKIYTDLAEGINVYEKKLQELKDSLEPDDQSASGDDEDSDDKRVLTNYEDYIVDYNIPHTLYESFTHKRPHAFELQSQKIEVKTWQGMVLETCEILISIDKESFMKFVNDPKMNGKKNKYFSARPEEMRKPEKLRVADILIETNMSANSCRNLIAKMLQRFNIKVNDYKVFFRADYSRLHDEE